MLGESYVMIKAGISDGVSRFYLMATVILLGGIVTTHAQSTEPTITSTISDKAKAEQESNMGDQNHHPETECTYRSYQWSTRLKRAVNRVQVKKKRSELTDEERDPDFPQCTVCREDQEAIRIKGLPSVTVCKYFAPQVRRALTQLAEERRANPKAFKIVSLIGYRVGKTRGRLHQGLRMDFSNHSYGTAIDINAKDNGLYRPCNPEKSESFKDIKRCKLRHGGHWKPDQKPTLSISRQGNVYKYFTRFWRWGGERKDRVRDFMHFSPTGL